MVSTFGSNTGSLCMKRSPGYSAKAIRHTNTIIIIISYTPKAVIHAMVMSFCPSVRSFVRLFVCLSPQMRIILLTAGV